MRLAYSTYALQAEDPFEALRRVHQIGYRALELNVGDAWPTAAARLGADTRVRLRDAYRAAGFPPPVLMHLIDLCAAGEDAAAKTRQLEATCRLAADLAFDGGRRVVTTTLGQLGGPWDEVRDGVVLRLAPYADVAEDWGVTLAIEAHVGQQLDSPEKAVWLVEAVGREAVRLNFDHSHFHVLGMELQHCVDLCAPWAVHTHIKDGRMVDGRVEFQLPGEGSLDLQAYFRAVAHAGIDLPITAEVSAQIWRRQDYDPWVTAARAYGLMHAAMTAATAHSG